MLNDVKQYSRICLAYGYTDLRFGIDGLARVVQDNFSLNPFRGRQGRRVTCGFTAQENLMEKPLSCMSIRRTGKRTIRKSS